MWRLKGLGCFNPPYAINRFGGSRFAMLKVQYPWFYKVGNFLIEYITISKLIVSV